MTIRMLVWAPRVAAIRLWFEDVFFLWSSHKEYWKPKESLLVTGGYRYTTTTNNNNNHNLQYRSVLQESEGDFLLNHIYTNRFESWQLKDWRRKTTYQRIPCCTVLVLHCSSREVSLGQVYYRRIWTVDNSITLNSEQKIAKCSKCSTCSIESPPIELNPIIITTTTD